MGSVGRTGSGTMDQSWAKGSQKRQVRSGDDDAESNVTLDHLPGATSAESSSVLPPTEEGRRRISLGGQGGLVLEKGRGVRGEAWNVGGRKGGGR